MNKVNKSGSLFLLYQAPESKDIDAFVTTRDIQSFNVVKLVYDLVKILNKVRERLNEKQKIVFGSYLTKEYSVEAAALFNPSIVPHPDQSNLKEGELRFVLTLRSVGEGHISSIGFMEGIIDKDHNIRFAEQGPWRTAGVKSACLLDHPCHSGRFLF